MLKICTFPDPVLRKIAAPVINVTDEIVRLSADMIETMRLSHGAGLAANQVGEVLRLIVLDLERENRQSTPLIVLNPVIVESSDEEIGEEGCLSVPKYWEFVKRAKKVFVKGMTIEERPFEMTCEGHMARVFQHEIDHLSGVLFIDRLSPVKKGIFKKKYMKSEK
jgi:peptide deformylase